MLIKREHWQILTREMTLWGSTFQPAILRGRGHKINLLKNRHRKAINKFFTMTNPFLDDRMKRHSRTGNCQLFFSLTIFFTQKKSLGNMNKKVLKKQNLCLNFHIHEPFPVVPEIQIQRGFSSNRLSALSTSTSTFFYESFNLE